MKKKNKMLLIIGGAVVLVVFIVIAIVGNQEKLIPVTVEKAEKGEIISIGVDVESSRALDDEIIDIIATPREKEWLATLADNQQRYWSKIVFSIKESVYKCYFPLAGDFLEFHDVEVILNPESGTFLASIVNPSKKLQLTRLQGRFVTTNQHIFSATTISCAEIEL